jgi:sarcosine oxidase
MAIGERELDVIVAGAGAMGSATTYFLAREGARVLAIDRWAAPHTHGSTHGRTRIIREAYFEDPSYVPLVQRAYANWATLESESGRTLFRRTGGLMIGPRDGELVAGALRSAREYGLEHELLSAREVRGRFPAFAVPDHMAGLLEPRAGILFPELCVETALTLARRHGAAVHFGERITRWEADAESVSVITDRAVYRARRLVLSVGAWLPALVPELRSVLEVERQLIHWFEPRAHRERFEAGHAPIAMWEHEPGRLLYTIPDVGHGVKVAVHHEGRIVDPDAPREPVGPAETAELRGLVQRLLPELDTPPIETATCLYTNTPDRHFLLDQHPTHASVLLVSPCSGHGFKFASAVGELAAAWATTGSLPPGLERFRWR